MLCRTARQLISQEMDGMLPAEKTPSFEEHLGRCGDCRDHRAELGLGRRLLQATAAEPADAFEWKLQLRLNRALQEAAATRTVPWEDAPRSAAGWWRGFAASSLAGVAVTALVAVLVWPSGPRPVESSARPAATLAAAATTTAAPTTSSRLVTDLSDRLPLTGARTRGTALGGGFLGRPVSQGLLADRARTGERLQPVSLSSGMLAGLDDAAALRAENARLRAGLIGLRDENKTLKALLAARGIAYLDADSQGQSPGR
ncbi:MAG: zf-HC2 domain-containing protein [bacterium]|nr:zf-HC2 domain-containing protein [bacterium]